MVPAALAVLIAAGCESSPGQHAATPGEAASAPSASDRHVLLVGLDGAIWKIIDQLIDDGELPNFRELISVGAHGRLRSLLPSRSPRIWTSIATGVPPQQHGILDFVYWKQDERHLFTSDRIKVPTIWEIASAQGVSVGVTNYWFTYPVWPVNGFIISDHTIPSRSKRMIQHFSKGHSPLPDPDKLVYPPELWAEIRKWVEAERIGVPNTPHNTLESRFQEIYNVFMEDQLVTKIALAADARYRPRLSIVYLKGIDRASHFFWQYFEPNHPNYALNPPSARQIALYGDVIPQVYRHTDALLGELRKTLRPQDVIVIASDHGFESVRVSGKRSGNHGPSPDSVDGICLFAGGPVRTGMSDLDLSLFDLAPTILHLLGLPVPRHFSGTVATSLFEEDFVASNPVRYADHDVADRPTHDEPVTVPLESERLEKLKALGYLK